MIVKALKSYVESVIIKKAPLNASTISSRLPSGKFSSSLKNASFQEAWAILILPASAWEETGKDLVTLSLVAFIALTKWP